MKEEAATNDPSAEIELGDVSHEAIQYFTPGTQCYLAGKFGARAGFIPVYRNLLHQGMEVFIKSGLLRFVNRAGTSHNIKTLWSLLKRRVQLPKLTRFDNYIAELHKFESIRCPEKILEMGMTGIMR